MDRETGSRGSASKWPTCQAAIALHGSELKAAIWVNSATAGKTRPLTPRSLDRFATRTHQRKATTMDEKQRKRAEAAAEKSIGQPMSVRINPRATVRGMISACRVVDAAPAAPADKAQFEVTMICGSAAVERKFVVNKLPQPERTAAE